MDKLCDNCDNMMNIKLNKELNKLVLDCPCCNNIKDWSGDTCIYKTNFTVNLSKIINTNQNITQDITLPSITNNPNIKCINEKCKESKSDIIFIKYDQDNMKYMYKCKHCGQAWTNTNENI
jgi:DNA-directed RNA polymerase subunit M/transcription elongation factor TFIIS